MSSQLPQQSQHQPQPQQEQMDLAEDIFEEDNGKRVIFGTIPFFYKKTHVSTDRSGPDYRRYRVFIERWFDRKIDKKRQAFVWGCHFLDFDWDGKEKKTIGWNDFDSHYWPKFRFQLLLEKMKRLVRPKPEFAPFSVIVTSLPCMHYLSIDHTSLLPFFSNRRYGHHLYMRTNGTITTAFFYMGFDHTEGKYKLKIMEGSISPIHQIYPVIRYEWEEPQPREALTYGLDFRFLKKARTDDQTGDRYYHRFGDHCLKVGNVFELTEDRLTSIDKIDPNEGFIGLYVCAGAKLVVFDSYHEDRGAPEHNRTLVQQGGFVICRGQFQIDFPIECGKNDEYDDYFDEMYLKAVDWIDFCDLHLKEVDKKPDSKVRPNPRTMKQPVLFLGPINSRFGAVTWGVEVRKDSLPTKKKANRPRKTVLYTPNHSRIIAIAEGEDAFREIRARIKYEMLHDSVVTEHKTDFAIPTKAADNQHDVAMVRRIVNVGNERSFDVEFRTVEKEYVGNHIIGNYNKTTIRADPGFDERIKKFLAIQTTRWAVPPMFPPAVFLYEQGGADVYSIPSKQFKIENFDNLYNNFMWSTIVLTNLHNNKDTLFQFKYYDKAVTGYHFERLKKKEEQSFDDKSGWYQRDGPMYRLGVDGWMWKRDDGGHIYYEDIYGFFHSSQPPFQSTGQIGGQSRGPSRGPSRGSGRGSSRGPSRGSGRGSSQGSSRGPSRN